MTTESAIFPGQSSPHPSTLPHLARNRKEAALLLQKVGGGGRLPETVDQMAWGGGPDGEEKTSWSQRCLGALGKRRDRLGQLAVGSWGQPEGKLGRESLCPQETRKRGGPWGWAVGRVRERGLEGLHAQDCAMGGFASQTHPFRVLPKDQSQAQAPFLRQLRATGMPSSSSQSP